MKPKEKYFVIKDAAMSSCSVAYFNTLKEALEYKQGSDNGYVIIAKRVQVKIIEVDPDTGLDRAAIDWFL